jgi:hypothetical protein
MRDAQHVRKGNISNGDVQIFVLAEQCCSKSNSFKTTPGINYIKVIHYLEKQTLIC